MLRAQPIDLMLNMKSLSEVRRSCKRYLLWLQCCHQAALSGSLQQSSEATPQQHESYQTHQEHKQVSTWTVRQLPVVSLWSVRGLLIVSVYLARQL